MVEVVAVPEDAFVENPKLEEIFSSIEKQLIMQTGFLKSMQSLQVNQVKFAKDLVNDAERSRLEESVGKGDMSIPAQESYGDRDQGDIGNTSTDEGSRSRSRGGLGGLGLAGLGALSIGGLAGKLLKGGLATLLAPVVIDFVVGAVKEVFGEDGLDLGIDTDVLQKIANQLKDQSGFVIGATILGGLFKKSWIGFALSTGYAIGGSLVDWLDTNEKGLIETPFGDIDPGVLSNFTSAIGLAVSGGLVLLSGKITKALGVAFSNIKTTVQGLRVPGVKSSKISPVKNDPGAPKAKPTANPARNDPSAPKAKPTANSARNDPGAPKAKPAGKLPSGTRVNSAGRVIDSVTGKFKSIDQVVDALKAEGRTAQLAKYAKFLKFAGPAMAVIPALIEPAMAIYNNEPAEVIQTQISGALGSIGGGALGAVVGGAALSVIPGVGTLIGALAGGVGGALGGEYLIEELVESLMGGADAKPVDPMTTSQTYDSSYTSSGAADYGKYSGNNDIGSVGGLREVPTASGTVDIPELILPPLEQGPLTGSGLKNSLSPVIPMTNKLDRIDVSMKTPNATSKSGVNVVNSTGGNTTNTTSVGGTSTTLNVFQSSGSSALSNNLPRLMTSN